MTNRLTMAKRARITSPTTTSIKLRLPRLPQELVVTEILSRLPAKSVARFRSLSKYIHHATTQQGFILLHHRHARRKPPSIILLEHREEGRSIALWACSDTASQKLCIRTLLQGKHIRAPSTTCHGLILYYAKRDHLYLLNPSTTEIALLPFGTGSSGGPFCHCAALAHIPATAAAQFHYKVVRIFYRGADLRRTAAYMRKENIHIACEVLTLSYGGGMSSWREAKTPPPFPVRTEVEAAFANGSLHWIIDSTRLGGSYTGHLILAFDVLHETFNVLPHPPACSPFRCNDMYLVALFEDGPLCLVDDHFREEQAPRADIWVLEDYSNGVWAKRWSIDFSRIDGGSSDSHRRFLGMHCGRLLLHRNRDWRKKNLDYYDPERDSYVTIIGPTKDYVWSLLPDAVWMERNLGCMSIKMFHAIVCTESLIEFGGNREDLVLRPLQKEGFMRACTQKASLNLGQVPLLTGKK